MKLELIGLTEIPLVDKGDNINSLIISALEKQNIAIEKGDIFLIAETIISKAEGNIIDISKLNPSEEAISIAKKTKKDPHLVEAILRESKEIVELGPDFIISETKHGFICANAGIDESNVNTGLATPLPKDPNKTAEDIRKNLEKFFKKEIAIIITDTQGRAFRNGAVGVAIGCSGISPIWERAGEKDLYNKELQITEIAIVDELAAAASLLMGQADEGIPVVIIRGFEAFDTLKNHEENINELLRPKEFDVFRK